MSYTRKTFTVCIGTALVMVASLLVTVATPASAAPITFTPVWNGGDLTASVTVPYSASDITTFTTEVEGPELGLPTTAGVTQVAQALMTYFEERDQLPSSTTGVAQPQVFPSSVIYAVTTEVADATTCAPCATVTVTIPAETVALWRTGLSGLVTFAAAWVSFYVAVGMAGLVTARGLPTDPPAGQTLFQQFVAQRPGGWATTLAIGATIANLVELPINDLFLGQQITYTILAPALTFAILQFINQKTAPAMTAWVATWAGKISTAVFPLAQQVGQDLAMQVLDPGQQAQAVIQMMADAKTALDALTTSIVDANLPGFIPGQFPAFLNDLPAPMAQHIRDALTAAFIDAAIEEGFPQLFAQAAPAGGQVYDANYPIDGQPTCADDPYEAQLPGDVVAENVCNGLRMNQSWIGYNTSGCTASDWTQCSTAPFQVTNHGLCLSPADEQAITPQRLILAWCDGSDAQLWFNEPWGLLNYAAGFDGAIGHSLCLDAPGQYAGLQLDVQYCDLSPAQDWHGFTAPGDPSANGSPTWLYTTVDSTSAGGSTATQRSATLNGRTSETSTSFWVGCEGVPAVASFTLNGGFRRMSTVFALDTFTPPELVVRVWVKVDGSLADQFDINGTQTRAIGIDTTGAEVLTVETQAVAGMAPPPGPPCTDSDIGYGIAYDAALFR